MTLETIAKADTVLIVKNGTATFVKDPSIACGYPMKIGAAILTIAKRETASK